MSELEPTITELEPTATERLRALLDERGVEWEDMSIRPYACTSWRDPDGEPCTALEGADDIPDGKLSAQALLTPEQAIAATLGSCNCSNNCTNGERTETCREVYLLMATDIGDGREEVLGVYATEEAATAAINENQFGYALHYVRKWEVDE